MLKKLLITLTIILTTTTLIYSQSGTLKGVIKDKKTKDPIPFVNIVIELDGKQLGGTTTNFDGNYTIKPIPPGKYDVKATFVGYKPLLIRGVIINSDKIRVLDIDMESTITTLETFEIIEYKVPLIDKDQTSTGGTMTSEEISKMSARSAQSVAVQVGGVFSRDGEMGSIRGSRTEGTVMYIDGIRVRGSSSLPKSALEQVTVITGGTPSRYGDATGGIINTTTKGPSRKFGAGVEFVTSELLDKYGYNLLGFNVQGPLIMGKDTNSSSSLLGFFIAGEASYLKDPRPYRTGVSRVKEDVLVSLEADPLRPSGLGFGTYQNSEYVHKDDIENIAAKTDADRYGINLIGKIDVRTTNNTNLTFGGTFDYGTGRLWSLENSMYNAKNNGEYITSTWRVYGRFTQRFPSDKDSKSIIKNVYYSIQADYSKYNNKNQNKDHKDDLFKYGYVGDFKTYKIKSYELGSDSVFGYNNVFVHNGFRDTLYAFTSSDINPDLSNYTQQYYNLYPLSSGYYINSELVQNGGGLLNGQLPDPVYSPYLWTNTGTPYNGYSVTNASQIGINAHGSADIGNHEVQFGLIYEQRVDRAYAYKPAGFWTLMRGLTNYHIEQLDKSSPHAVFDANGVFQDTIWYDRLYDASSQTFFDINLRKKLGLSVDGLDWIDVDNIDPSFFSVDMFSADELLNNSDRIYRGNSYVSYYGYDHTGKLLKDKPSFDDFFNDKDDDGNYTRDIGAFEPIYMAGYIQDKFAFKDLIFNIGLRVDRYDANQKVLKDPYLLFEAKTVGEVNAVDFGSSHPSNMGSDYVVYVNDVHNPSSIVGYRNEDVWYNSEGTEISDPSVLEGSTGIAPYLVDPDDNVLSSKAFKDFEPQISYMPRISFSFPISDEALFFAHYDVLTKRPTTGTRLNPASYYYIESIGQNRISNPDLKPEKTVDYELGFQQVLNKSSALRFSAYYRQMKDMVQIFKYTDAYPVSYISYNNIDFGTVKGMTISYDLRRSKNVWVKTSYTMQFANGTGSSATSGLNLVTSGQPNLRTLGPYSYDQRHQIKTTIDFRFDEGKKYNGPVINRKVKGTNKVKSIALLENTGFNITFNGGSGTPYSRQSNVTSAILGGGSSLLQGSINGSRLPWQFRIDARIDKDFSIKWGKDKEKSKKITYVNIYLQILNLLNSKNVMGVYRYTGNPDDDGFLAAAEYQNQIESNNDPQAFRDLYEIRVNNPGNYSLPRRIRLGIALNF